MITYITLSISILSFIFSTFLFFSKVLSNRYKLGISIHESIPNVPRELLYLRISFVNESSAPITIQNLTILDHHKEKFPQFGEPSRYTISPGEIFPGKVTVKNEYHSKMKATEEKTEYLPFVVQPYSAFTGFFAFYFNGTDSNYINNQTDIFLEVESSKGFLLAEKNFAPNYFRLEETTNNKTRPVFIYWNVSPTRRIIPYIKSKLKKLGQLLVNKISKILK